MKLIKRALITYALVRIAQKIAFGVQFAKLEQEIKEEKVKDLNLRAAVRTLRSDIKEAKACNAQVAISKAELKKEMIEHYV